MYIQFQKKYLYLILFILIGNLGFSQLSKTHYIPPLTSGLSNAIPDDQYFYLSTPSTTDINYTIMPVGQTAPNYITGTISNTSPEVIPLGTGYGQLFIQSSQTSTVVNDSGYIIEAEDLIYVSVRMRAGGGTNPPQAGALVSKGLSALGTTFRVGSFTNEGSYNQDNYLNFVSVMATENNTQVKFDDFATGLFIENYGTVSGPINITLNEGESYTIATSIRDAVANEDGLIGTLLTSNNPVVVNCGSANGSFGDASGNGRDYGIDQIAGLAKVGTQYIFVRGAGADDWENVLIVPHTPNTTISVNGGAPFTITGRYELLEGTNYSANDNIYIETSEPVFAYQGIGGGGEANQGMFFVPPLSCEARGNIDNIASIDNIGGSIYNGGISIVTKATATITINNLPLSNFSTTGPNSVTGNPDYVTYQITGLANDISVQGDDELYVAYYNINGAATSGSFYSGFPSAPEINFDAEFVTLGNCIPNIDLSVANAENFDTFSWYFDDGSGTGFVDMMNPNATITPINPGKYKLVGVILCSGLTLESAEVPVSICPDDRDNDGIIDNIDIDNDNDGILNCTESKGDVIINLTDTNNPQLIFQDNSTDSSITSGLFTESNSAGSSNTFSGTNTGVFTSNIPAATNAENDYSLTFTESINFNLSEDTSVIHTSVDGEYFIAKISPVNKNITLVDPDDRLLIDSNFDGVFETGITFISGSEIHFRINPSPMGATPYEFYANQVDGFAFNHILTNITDSSTFSGIIALTCFKLDTDSDGVKDELDLDSDNDGIPDSIENQGTLVTLSSTDSDSNGLDDAFDITTTPIDSDTDGIYDFYDLDSDNDGIYDLIETGQLGTLSDTNLDGIEDGPTYGMNGWADAAETSPDSNIIGYTLNDLDNDTIFTYLDSDSDDDGCSDVIEAGFSDANGDDFLGDNIATTNTLGLVTNRIDGYTIPNSDYLDFAPLTITTQPINTEVCESSTGTISIISPDAETYQWEVSTDGINWNMIVDDATYNGSQTANLNITNTPISFNTYQYRVKIDRIGNTCGLYSDEIDLIVILLPIANTAPNMLLCDDDNNGSMPFDLSSQNTSINTNIGMAITYHTSQADADTGNAPITSPFQSGNTTIFARVENNSNTTCYDTSSFNLVVYQSAFPLDEASIIPIQECDDTSVGTDTDGFKTFNLTQKETEILNGQATTDFTLSYFTDANRLPSSQISNPSTFNNSVSGGQTIYIRMTNNFYNACFTDTAFEIEVYELPQVSNPNTYKQCDDDSNDGQALFNLTLDNIKEEINTNFIAQGLVFTYYETQTEAENATNAIINPDTYQDALGFTIETVWVRVENPNTCFRVVPLNLEVNPSSAALASYTPTPKYECDDGSDNRDGIAAFDMTNIRNEISTNVFPTFNVTVHFYETQTDAELETNEILDIANHENTNAPNTQNIWVRVKSDLGNDCLGLEEFQNILNVEALPTANPITITRACDFDITDTVLTYPFDVSQLESNILNGQNPLSVTITYFDSIGDPLLYADGTPVTSPIQPTFLTDNQTITIRVTNNNTQDPDGPCYDETTLRFIIDEQPIANPVALQIVCDGDAGDINDDGVYPFDTSTFTSTILDEQTNMEIYYDYIDENGNLITDSTSLPNPLISGNQTVTVEVINPINTTCTANTNIQLTVNPLPEFILDEEILVCNSPFVPFDLVPIQANPSEVFDYQWTFEDGTILGNNLILENISQPGKYTLALTNPTTLCVKSLSVNIRAADVANITLDDIKIVDLSENNTLTILNPSGLGNSTYMFSLVLDSGGLTFPYQENPVFNNVRAGFYTLFVQDNEATCNPVELSISIIGHPKFFTPNGDGYNDFWQIKGISTTNQVNSTVSIYDRYGKLLKQIRPSEQGWNGTFNGAVMPTDDYWFKVFLEDGRAFSGHFTLKR